jgi:hypothetical protein
MGRPLDGKTHQRYRDDSCRARGQAWGIYGFTCSSIYDRLSISVNYPTIPYLSNIGKIAIADTILNKAGRLSATEWQEIKILARCQLVPWPNKFLTVKELVTQMWKSSIL